MSTTAQLPDLVYGDWEWDETTDTCPTYPARVYGGWSGGVCFLTDRETAEKIVEAQARLAAETNGDADTLSWDGDVLVRSYGSESREGYGPDYEPFNPERVEPNAEGLYDCSFGWCWLEEVPG